MNWFHTFKLIKQKHKFLENDQISITSWNAGSNFTTIFFFFLKKNIKIQKKSLRIKYRD
jgi:hypothetical protein